MTIETAGADDREQRLEGALTECLAAVESGRAAELCGVLARHREFATDMAEFLAIGRELEGVAGPLRSLTTESRRSQDETVLPHEGRASSSPPAVQTFGEYELKEVLGGGGMGVVYRAWHRRLDRFVAVKMIRSGQFASAADVRRFQEEAKNVAQLDHPQIVPVYECGEHQGHHYFTMKLMESGSLRQQIEQGPVPSRRAAEWLRAVARAVQAAHQAGIIHRDLKPANIVLDDQGQAHVTDFGLAKWVNGDHSLTATGAIVGTILYMAPEQADGKATIATDVYGLGAILYALLTGRPPFQSETALDTLEQIRHQEPVPPRLINPKVDRALELICLKCLEKEPGRRYASAAAMAEDLDCYLNGEPLRHARSSSWSDILWRPVVYHLPECDLMRDWDKSGLGSAIIGLIGHTTVFALAWTGQPIESIWLALGITWILLALNIWVFLIQRTHSAHPIEGHALVSWLGYMLAIPVLFLGPGMGQVSAVLAAYPALALLTGVCVFFAGSLYWGHLYLFGIGFFILALLMRCRLEWAPLEFGLFKAGYHIYMAFERHLLRRKSVTLAPSIPTAG